MSWSSGVILFNSLVEVIKETVMDRDERQENIYRTVIDAKTPEHFSGVFVQRPLTVANRRDAISRPHGWVYGLLTAVRVRGIEPRSNA